MSTFRSTRHRNGTMLLRSVLLVPAFATMTVAAQTNQPGPSWGTTTPPAAAPQPNATRPLGATGLRQGDRVAATASPSPPVPRDCRKLVTQAEPSYIRAYRHSETNGYVSPPNVDLGYVVNTTMTLANDEHTDHNDLQLRIEQLRCEDQNIDAKLDYIIRKLQ